LPAPTDSWPTGSGTPLWTPQNPPHPSRHVNRTPLSNFLSLSSSTLAPRHEEIVQRRESGGPRCSATAPPLHLPKATMHTRAIDMSEKSGVAVRQSSPPLFSPSQHLLPSPITVFYPAAHYTPKCVSRRRIDKAAALFRGKQPLLGSCLTVREEGAEGGLRKEDARRTPHFVMRRRCCHQIASVGSLYDFAQAILRRGKRSGPSANRTKW
jgi:hypothetical protein